MSTKALFACSKCFSRHPFEELSAGQQLCKDCRGTFPVVKCTYCRSEFQQSNKGSTSAICKKCEQCVKQYGKPSACECCSIIAAFIGSKCQRCANSEAKYGQPVTCDQCKQRCAYDRPDDNKKVDGKLLCWLCTCSYKRALVKARQVEKDTRLTKKRPHPERSSKENSSSKKLHRDIPKHSSKVDVPEKNPRQGGNNTGTFAAAVTIDPNSSDHVVAMTNLKEQIASLQKKLNFKDKELLDKDKLITELKSKNWDKENEMRTRMKDLERLYDMKVDLLNKKVANLLKEVSTLTKSAKQKNGTTFKNNTESRKEKEKQKEAEKEKEKEKERERDSEKEEEEEKNDKEEKDDEDDKDDKDDDRSSETSHSRSGFNGSYENKYLSIE